MLSFRNRLLILLIGLVVGAQTVTLFTALASTKATVSKDAGEQLDRGAKFARQHLENRGRLLTGTAHALAFDYNLRRVVATGDRPTAGSILASLATRAGSRADLTLALNPDGTLLAQAEDAEPVASDVIAAVAGIEASDAERAQFLVTPNSVYQVVTAPVLAPEEVGRIALGFTVDVKLADEVREQAGVDVAFLAISNGERRYVTGTSPSLAGVGLDAWNGLGDTPKVTDIGGQKYLAVVTHLSTQGQQLDLALMSPLKVVMAPYRQLALALGLIVGATLIAAAIAGFYLGRGAARPVQQLAVGAARIAEGDYSAPVDGSSGGRELANLAQAFNTMQRGIAERETRLRHQARHDEATNLPNRLFAEEWLTAELAALKPDVKLGVAWLAVTNLQEISASLGFEISAQLVQHLAENLGEIASEHTLVARVDTSHFLVAATPMTDAGLRTLLSDVRERARRPLTTAGIALQAAVVLGAAMAPRHGQRANELLRCAEAALETAIQQKQSQSLFERASDEAQRRALQLGADLPQAMASGQLRLVFQPKFRMSDRTPRGVETLVRWQHPEFGNVSPAEFIPIAERTGVSGLVTRWVLRNALTQLATWQRQGIRVEMAVNLSAADITDPDMLEYILEALRNAKLAASSLMLEITESVLLHEPDVAKRNMELLRIAGVRFSIDDFGTGYSSLSQLRELPADELKIDMSFVRAITQGAEHVAVIRAIVDLGQGLGLRTVAEGVEEEAQWRLLADLGCDYVQGYLTGRPVPADELTPQLLAARDSDAASEPPTASLRVLELRRKE